LSSLSLSGESLISPDYSY